MITINNVQQIWISFNAANFGNAKFVKFEINYDINSYKSSVMVRNLLNFVEQFYKIHWKLTN